jgi:hypothetical protein
MAERANIDADQRDLFAKKAWGPPAPEQPRSPRSWKRDDSSSEAQIDLFELPAGLPETAPCHLTTPVQTRAAEDS